MKDETANKIKRVGDSIADRMLWTGVLSCTFVFFYWTHTTYPYLTCLLLGYAVTEVYLFVRYRCLRREVHIERVGELSIETTNEWLPRDHGR